MSDSSGSGPITVVSGLPRSGTSMMMKMLEAGGIPLLTDGLRSADVDNPEGYYEYERVKGLDKGDAAWLPDAQGKAVKVISALLEHMPAGYTYRAIFMNRRIEEVLASQKKMLTRRSEAANPTQEAGPPNGQSSAGGPSDEKLADLFARHLAKVKAWLAAQPNWRVLEMDYNAVLADPEHCAGLVAGYLGGRLDVISMASTVNPDLYRNRRGGSAE